MKSYKFTTIYQAKKDTGLNYLGNIDISSKLVKNKKVSNQFTYILYLMPSSASGYNVCPMATKECIAGCLNTSGRVKIDTKNRILNARMKKTKLFFEHKEFFLQWMFAEIKNAKKIAKKNGFKFSVRLNGTSDLNWQIYKLNGKNVFETFSNVQFYDYTKIYKMFSKITPNYHLTFSYSGYNWINSLFLLNEGFNVAVVFNVKKGQPLPKTFRGYKIIDGDLTDYRPDDKKGCIVGLRWKDIKNKKANEFVKHSPFVVQTEVEELV